MNPILALKELFNPAPHITPIEDPEEVAGMYKYWRIRIFYSMFFGYAFYYFTRKSFIFIMPAMIEHMGFSKSDLGILASILSLTYGVSKFASGIFADRSNPRYIMSFGLILTGFFNICFGLSSSLLTLSIFWGLNGWFQGFGWPPCARYLTHWYSKNERGRWWAIWNTSHNVGGATIPILAAFIAQYYGWRIAMYVPGVICILAGFLLMNRLRDTPQSLGLPVIEKFRNNYEEGHDSVKESSEKQPSVKEILFQYILTNKYIWILAFSYFFIYAIRTAVNDWSALFLVETKNYSVTGAGMCVGWFEVGGFLGSLCAGWSSDTIFKGNRGPVNVIFSFGIISAILFFWLVPPGFVVLDALSMFMFGFWIFGPQMLIGMSAAEMVHKKAVATASGFTGWFAYIGAACAGYPLGRITEDWGWNGFFVAITISAVIATTLLLGLWFSTSRQLLKKQLLKKQQLKQASCS